MWHWLADPRIFKLPKIYFYHHEMLAGACRSTQKYFLEWFSKFCAKYEVIYGSRGGQNNTKIMVFGLFTCVTDVLEPLKLFNLVLLIKTQLLVPNLCLGDLAFENYGQERLKFCGFLLEKLPFCSYFFNFRLMSLSQNLQTPL